MSVEACEPRRLFAAFPVTSISDDAAVIGSLRWAIGQANSTPGPDVIPIAIAGADKVVTLGSPLPPITEAVELGLVSDLEGGYTDPATPQIELNASALVAGSNVLTIADSGDFSYITGLSINRSRGNAINIAANSNSNVLSGPLHIGTDIAGTARLGNAGAGVVINGNDNTVAGARIVYNGDDGISVVNGVGNDVGFLGADGEIRSNGGEAIDIGAPGYTANDNDNTGSNFSVNTPVLASVSFPSSNTVTVSGTLNSLPNTTFILDFYANPIAAREGWDGLVNTAGGTAEVTTNNSGAASFTFTLADADGGTIAPASFITATATVSAEEAVASFSTSEFSAPLGATAPPRVQQVFVSGSAWTSDGQNVLTNSGTGSRNGFAVPDGAAQLSAVPYGNLNQVRIQFTENVSVQQNDLSITGVSVASYATTGFSYDANTFTATWTLPTVSRDRILLNLDGDAGAGVADPSGTLLDGDWANGADTYFSGNGSAGGDFRFQVDVMPGDINGSGTTDVTDLGLFSTNYNKSPRGPRQGDLTGDGKVDVTDLGIFSTNYGKSLPTGTPTALSLSSLASRSSQTSAQLVLAATEPVKRPSKSSAPKR